MKIFTDVIMTSFLSNSHYLTANGPFLDTGIGKFDTKDNSERQGRERMVKKGGGGGV